MSSRQTGIPKRTSDNNVSGRADGQPMYGRSNGDASGVSSLYGRPEAPQGRDTSARWTPENGQRDNNRFSRASEGESYRPSHSNGHDRKRRIMQERNEYLQTFCEHMASVQRASRPRTVPLLKSFYVQYRVANPVARLSPSSLVYDLRTKRKVVVITDYNAKLIEWTETLVKDYGASEISTSSPSRVPLPATGSTTSSRQQITRSEHILLNSSREELEKNKEHIEVANIQELLLDVCSKQQMTQSDFDADRMVDGDGTVVVQKQPTPFTIVFQVRNKKIGKVRALKHPYFLVGAPGLSVEAPVGRAGERPIPATDTIMLEPPAMKFFTFKFLPKMHGTVKDTLVFDFGDFVICRYISIRVEDSEIMSSVRAVENQGPLAKQKSQRRKPKPIAPTIVRGPRVEKPLFEGLPIPLAAYEIPKAIRERFENLDGDDPFRDDEMDLSPETYRTVFETLQYIEEIQMEADIRKYDLERVKLSLGRRHFVLNVQGLAEKRPNVMYGDKIYVRRSGYGDREYEGYINYMSKEDIQIQFNPAFITNVYMANMEFDVRFTFSRTPLRRCYQALQLMDTVPVSLKFPNTPPLVNAPPANPRPLDMNGPGMRDLNEEQKMAIRNVVEKRNGPNPYMHWKNQMSRGMHPSSPQLLQGQNMAILALAPSNLAADQLVERLSKSGFTKMEMIRIHSYQRPVTEISPVVAQYSRVRRNMEGIDEFSLLLARDILPFKVVVTTCITGGLLYSAGIPRGHFKFFCVDEAGQATEPELWISIAGLIDPLKGSIVLAGDPKQLGPTLRSVLAKRYGLEKSYMERLIELPLYAQADAAQVTKSGASTLRASQQYVNPSIITKLVRNYRSHPKILAISSSLFYNSEQVAAADKNMRESFEDWEGLPTKGFPIIFQGIQGRDMQEGTSPSWYNPDEIGLVKKWVLDIFKARGKGVSYDQIGIITPYRCQVQKIDTLLRGLGCKVASVEEFQGQERRIIIISTVRSTAAHVQQDMMHNLGFLQNYKRFNVAVSRAKALLVVIGNPVILEMDPYWGALVKYCRANKALIGYDPAGGASLAPKFLDQLSRLRMAEENQTTAQEDPAWDFRG
ncbi:AAA domain-containing protein [Chytridium lagenaria]|nr:AAA domain-containing protein [Chytridium lagenaria]